jgi:hypothetical protein
MEDLLSMEDLKDSLNKEITALYYLEKLDEAMIWNSYREVVPMTIAEVDPTKY